MSKITLKQVGSTLTTMFVAKLLMVEVTQYQHHNALIESAAHFETLCVSNAVTKGGDKRWAEAYCKCAAAELKSHPDYLEKSNGAPAQQLAQACKSASEAELRLPAGR